MPFSLSLSSYLLDASACFDREASTVAQVIIYNSRSLSKLNKAKTNKKESGLINEKKKQVSPSFKKQHSLSLALKHSCPKIITAYQVVKVRLKWYKIDSNDKWCIV